jgi:hypothetical protein
VDGSVSAAGRLPAPAALAAALQLARTVPVAAERWAAEAFDDGYADRGARPVQRHRAPTPSATAPAHLEVLTAHLTCACSLSCWNRIMAGWSPARSGKMACHTWYISLCRLTCAPSATARC